MDVEALTYEQREPAVLNTPIGRITYRFHAREVRLGPAARGSSVRFRYPSMDSRQVLLTELTLTLWRRPAQGLRIAPPNTR